MPDEPFSLGATPPGADGGAEETLDLSGSPSSESVGPSVTLPADGGGAYFGFGLSVAILWDSGLSCAPTAGGPRARTVFWRVSAASSSKLVSFAIARVGAAPAVPHIDTGSANDVLLKVAYSTPTPDVLPDGTVGLVIFGQYLYGMQIPQDPMAPLLYPNGPLGVPVQLQLDPAQFSRLLVGPVRAPSEYDGQAVNF